MYWVSAGTRMCLREVTSNINRRSSGRATHDISPWCRDRFAAGTNSGIVWVKPPDLASSRRTTCCSVTALRAAYLVGPSRSSSARRATTIRPAGRGVNARVSCFSDPTVCASLPPRIEFTQSNGANLPRRTLFFVFHVKHGNPSGSRGFRRDTWMALGSPQGAQRMGHLAPFGRGGA